MNLTARWSELRIALMLLTRLPAGRITGQVPSMAQSVWAWPIVGAVVGGLAALTYGAAFAVGFAPVLAALLALTVGLFVTGAMHEDGLADLADGFGGGQSRDRKLEIMRDSRIGTYGVAALILSILLRIAAIESVADPIVILPAMITLAVISRTMMALWLYALPPARTDGLGHGAARPAPLAVAAALTLGGMLCVVLLPIGTGVGVVVATVLGSGLVAMIAMRQIGGQTGDVMGAAQQIGEISGWLALVVLIGM